MDISWMTLIIVILLIVVGYFILSMITSYSSFSSSKVSSSITKLKTQSKLNIASSTHSFTFSIWIFINNFYKHYGTGGRQNLHHIISTGSPLPPIAQRFLLTLDMNSNILKITMGEGSYDITVDTVPLQTWVSVIVTVINGNSADIYINGKLFKTVVPPLPLPPPPYDVYLNQNNDDDELMEIVKPTTNSPLPFWYGTAVSPDFKDVIKNTDPTTFKTLKDAGQEMRQMFDRRTNSFEDVNAYLFNVEYSDNNGFEIEIQVNPEFSQATAREYARQYAIVIGRLPIDIRRHVETVLIHNGKQPFGGAYNSLLIHVEQGDEYIDNEILEEIFIHEASHASLDSLYANDADWINAQQKDNAYISTYAKDFPQREDIAESFLAYFAVTYRKDRISTSTYDKIISTIPNRINFFDSLNLDMSPYTKSLPPTAVYLLPAGYITVGGYNSLDGYISTTYDNKSIGPQEAWKIYSSGYGGGGGSGIGDFFNKYKIRFAFVKDNVELSRLDI